MTALMIWLSFLIRKMPKNRKKETNITINLQSLIMEWFTLFDTMHTFSNYAYPYMMTPYAIFIYLYLSHKIVSFTFKEE